MSFFNVLKMYNKLQGVPLGKSLFNLAFCFKAPYFLTIFPSVNDLKAGYVSVSLKQRWIVQNHIKTVHAIAACNLAELAMGLIAEATIPADLRWLPMGMEVNYKKKATGKLTATSTIDPTTFFQLPTYPGPVFVPIEIKNEEGVLVTDAKIKLWISKKPEKKQ